MRNRTRKATHEAWRAALAGCGSAATRRALCRTLARQDLFYLLVHVLGRADVDRDWLFARCREVQARPDGYIDLWAREHYKSTIITFGLTIQGILNDPELTVGIFSHTRPAAKGFLRQIKREFEANAALKALFPDVLWPAPERQAPGWSEESGIVVRRKGNPKEATVEAWGLVDGQPVGKHFRLLVFDDVVTRESVSTPEMIAKTTEAWALALNLGTDGGAVRTIGTRYHLYDSYRTIMDRKAAVPRVHPATADGSIEGAPVLLSAETLRRKRREMGPYVFGSQMLLDPKADTSQGFREEWLCVWPAREGRNLNLYLVVDPASGRKTNSDYTAIWVIGLGADRNYYALTMVRDRLSLTERADVLFHLHREFRPLAVGYEEYGMQTDIEHLRDRMARENYRFRIVPLGGRLAKADRIRRLIPLFEQGRVVLPEHCWRSSREGEKVDLTRVFVEEEYLSFPVAAHDDMLDALSRIVDPAFPAAFPGAARRRPAPRSATTDYPVHDW